MRVFALIIAMLSALCGIVNAQTTGVITGRVTIGDKPAPGIAVALMLMPTQQSVINRQQAPAPRATTDEDGRYKITGVVAGQYNVIPLAPLYSVQIENRFGLTGKTVVVAEGETIEGIDFALTRGGVITGRITDADGRPIIAEQINLSVVDDQGRSRFFSASNSSRSTDDRGIYRIFGLPAGRYIVSVGNEESDGRRVNYRGGSFRRTFHPDATEEAKAAIIEVTAGGEAKGINIKVGRRTKTYEVSGRVLDGESGKPLSGMSCIYNQVGEDGKYSDTLHGLPTGAGGEFRAGGLLPGRYTVYAVSDGEKNVYAERIFFEIKDENVNGLEVKARPASIISGVIVVEGTDDPAVLNKLPQLNFGGSMILEGSPTLQLPDFKFGQDGSFRIVGVRPGKVRIVLNPYRSPKGFSLLRMERGGIEQQEGIEVAPGENITDLRIVLDYGTSVIRGQMKVEGGALPDGTRSFVTILRVNGDKRQPFMPVEIDTRGSFVIDGLSSGDYELTLNARNFSPPGSTGPPAMMTTKKVVTVANNSIMEVTLTLNLSGKGEE